MKNDESNESRVGRPTKYSEETIDRLCAALADGMPIGASAWRFWHRWVGFGIGGAGKACFFNV